MLLYVYHFISFLLGLIFYHYMHFCAFLVKSEDLLSLFFFTRLWRIIFSFFFHCCPTSCMCCLHCSSRRFSGGSYLGFLFCFFVLLLEKQICFGSERVARDKLVFGMLKHGHVSFQILTRYFYSLDFETKPQINMLLIVFYFRGLVFLSLIVFYSLEG